MLEGRVSVGCNIIVCFNFLEKMPIENVLLSAILFV